MKNISKPENRTISRIGFCLVTAVVFLTVSLQPAVREKPVFTGNPLLVNHYGVDNGLFSHGYWSGVDMSNQGAIEPINDEPQVSKSKVLGEIFVGMLGNVGGGILGAMVGTQIIKDDSEAIIPRGAILGFFPGAIFGSALGVYAVGNSGNLKGSFGQALLGSFLGECGAIAISFLLKSPGAALILFIALPPMGSALLFNNSLKYKSLPVSHSLLYFNKGDFKIGIPYVHIQYLPGYSKNNKAAFGFSVNLVNIVL